MQQQERDTPGHILQYETPPVRRRPFFKSVLLFVLSACAFLVGLVMLVTGAAFFIDAASGANPPNRRDDQVFEGIVCLLAAAPGVFGGVRWYRAARRMLNGTGPRGT